MSTTKWHTFKRKRVHAPKDVVSGGPLRWLSVGSFEMFDLLQLTSPVSMEQMAASVAELRAKKEWYLQYKEQPRDSVCSDAAEIRKKAVNATKRSTATTGAAKHTYAIRSRCLLSR
jgi:hypothetical protein